MGKKKPILSPKLLKKKKSKPKPTQFKSTKESQSVISTFHELNKRLEQVKNDKTLKEDDKVKITSEIENKKEGMGGLERYQNASLYGLQAGKFNSSKWVLDFLKEHDLKDQTLLDVGSIKNFYKDTKWIQSRCIDLNPLDSDVEKCDFFDVEGSSYDVLVLSLVINFVGDPRLRGDMIKKCRDLVKMNGYLFVILPLPCIENSRYLKHSLFLKIFASVGFKLIENKNTAKLAQFIFQRESEGTNVEYPRKMCRGGEERNNFCIILSNKKRSLQDFESKEDPAQKKKKIKKTLKK